MSEVKDAAPVVEEAKQSGESEASQVFSKGQVAELVAEELRKVEEKHAKNVASLTSSLQRDKAKAVKELQSKFDQQGLSFEGDDEQTIRNWAAYGQRSWKREWTKSQLEGTGIEEDDSRLDTTNEYTLLATLNKAIQEDRAMEREELVKTTRDEIKKAREELMAEVSKKIDEKAESAGLTKLETAPLQAVKPDTAGELEKWHQAETARLQGSGDFQGHIKHMREWEARLAALKIK